MNITNEEAMIMIQRLILLYQSYPFFPTIANSVYQNEKKRFDSMKNILRKTT